MATVAEMPTHKSSAREQKQFFDVNGYLVVPNIISPAQLAELRTNVEALMDGKLKPTSPTPSNGMDDFEIQWEPAIYRDPNIPRREKIRIAFHLCHTHTFFAQHASRPEILDVVTNLMGPDIKLYSDQLFVKPAHHGSAVPFHQDSAYWPGITPNMLSCWLAIDDATVENGCVHVIPGTHRSTIGHIKVDGPNGLTLKPEELDLSKEVAVTLKAGSAMFHHSLTVHRSFPNHSDHSRRGIVTIYMPATLKWDNPPTPGAPKGPPAAFLNPNFLYGYKLLRGKDHPGCV